ncbi:hypothetical protein [Bacillus sp. NPDC094106]|uniref:hypothetical protein n=1 Tax=Bacillus sp. NPDC094106 TaxID=3363949 RepID=UPI003822556C
MEKFLKKVADNSLTIKSRAYTYAELEKVTNELIIKTWEQTKVGESLDFSETPLMTIFLNEEETSEKIKGKIVLELWTDNMIKEPNEKFHLDIIYKPFYHIYIEISDSIIESKKISMEYLSSEQRTVQELENMIDYTIQHYLPECKTNDDLSKTL